ncbi:MAG: pentapeptide repeat-containing protein [Cyanobacteria bacterium J06623_7]
MSLPVKAQTETRSYLTSEILRSQTQNLIPTEGRDTLDLSNFIIDLNNADSEFSQYFYQEINNALSHSSQPVNLKFSNSVVQGDLKLNRLGITSYVGEGALSTLFTPAEREKIIQFYPLKVEAKSPAPLVHIFRGSLYLDGTVFTSSVDGANSLCLQSLGANGAQFQGITNFSRVIFAKDVDFSDAIFTQNASFSHSHFFSNVKFAAAELHNLADFTQTQFEASSSFEGAVFNELADFSRSAFIATIDLSNAIFRDRLTLAKSKFLNPLLLVNSSLDKTVTLRDIYLNSLINLQDAHFFNRLDFSNAFFTPQARINVSGLAFDAAEAQIIGQPGIIGQYLSLNRLQGNETVFRNLIRNFRQLEQITDANNLEYEQKQLALKQISDRLTKTSWRKIFTWSWLFLVWQWSYLSLLLLFGNYGTNINLIFTLGIITLTLFSLLYWSFDRYRPKIAQPIIPPKSEVLVMVLSYLGINFLAVINVFLVTDRPWLTLTAISVFLLPIPLSLTCLIYYQGRYHKLLDTSYFVENGQYREFRLLIGRLPIMPRFPFFRDRFMPLLWDRRWNWLNYYDFSLNNIFKLGFNDIRLRDRHLPGLISTLVWYQWCLGVLYIVLLLWTLSRTIPGLNLLIYF